MRLQATSEGRAKKNGRRMSRGGASALPRA